MQGICYLGNIQNKFFRVKRYARKIQSRLNLNFSQKDNLNNLMKNSDLVRVTNYFIFKYCSVLKLNSKTELGKKGTKKISKLLKFQY